MSDVSVGIKVNVKGLDELVGGIKEFLQPKSINPSPLGKATAAAARDLYLNMQRVAPVNIDGTAKHPGLLKASVYRFNDPKKSTSGNHIVYQVGVNLRKAPHFHLAEHGHWFYKNYMPRKVREGVIRSRKKTSGIPLGEPVFRAKARPYLEQSFSQNEVAKAVETVKRVYAEEFNKAVG